MQTQDDHLLFNGVQAGREHTVGLKEWRKKVSTENCNKILKALNEADCLTKNGLKEKTLLSRPTINKCLFRLIKQEDVVFEGHNRYNRMFLLRSTYLKKQETINNKQAYVQTGEEVIRMANQFETIGYRCAFYEEYLTDMVVVSKAWIIEQLKNFPIEVCRDNTMVSTDWEALKWKEDFEKNLLGEAKDK